MTANLNLKQRVKAGSLSVDQALQILREKAGADTERTHTYRWLMRLKAAGVLFRGIA